MCKEFTIFKNEFLMTDNKGYYHQFYTGYRQPDNPDFINTLKNTFNQISLSVLTQARDKVIEILLNDLPEIIEENDLNDCLLVCVPRAKSKKKYNASQLMFLEAVSMAADNINGINDGTDCIERIEDTYTTHLRKPISIPNDGNKPYPGITINTCRIDIKRIMNQDIILVDDIYTKSINIDEDCIQTLINSGANKVIFYSIGYTRRS